MYLWKVSYTLHTHLLSIIPPLQTIAAPNAFAVAVAVTVAVAFTVACSLELTSGPASSTLARTDRPQTHWLVPARFALDASPKRSLPCFLAFWDTAQVPLDLGPLILTTARRQFIPRNRRDQARKPHQGAALR